jgi:hypothetical protein
VFKDFRPKLQPKGAPQSPPREEIDRLFRKGELIRARKLCARLGFPLSDFQSSIEAGARKQYNAHQAGLVLTFMHDTGMAVGIDALTLLKAMFALNDYHGFLKQAHRFKIVAGIEAEIDAAIQRLIEKKQVADAEGWRRKLSALREQERTA